MLNGLNVGVVMVLVDFLVDCCRDILVLVRANLLLGDSLAGVLRDCSLVVTVTRHKVGNC